MGYYKPLRKEAQNLASKILVSTPDLLALLPNAIYLPNPVDVEHFSKDRENNKNNNTKDSNKSLTITTEAVDSIKILQFCKENNIGLKIEVFDRTTKPLLYQEIPKLLKKYSVYVDIRIVNDQLLENLSKTAIESLACGLRVLNYKLEYIDKLPEMHEPVNVVNQLQNIYNKL